MNHRIQIFLSIFCLILGACIPVAKAQTTAAPIPYGNNKDAGQYILLNGVKHYYEVYGSGNPMLLIHGNGTGIVGWAGQIAYFSKKYKVYAIDCRGRGKSDLGEDSLTYMQQAKDMNAFINELHMDSVMVVGKSDGGIIGILMGIYYPQHLKKIVAFGANMWPDSTALYPQVVTDITNERKHAEAMLHIKDNTKIWRLEREKYRMMEFQPHITAADLHRITVPVMVMSCDRDVIREEHTLFIYKNIPKADLCMLPGETHHVVKENVALFNQMVDKFLSEPFKDDTARF